MDHAAIMEKLQARHASLVKSVNPSAGAFQALEADYHRALSLFPEHPAFLFGLGTLYSHTDRSGAAIAMLKHSMACGSLGPEPWLNIASAYKNEHKDDEAAEAYTKALEICEQIERRNSKAARNGEPLIGSPEELTHNKTNALHGMASLFVNAGQPEKVIAWANRSLEVKVDDRFALWNKGLGYLEMGNFKEGFRLYDEAGFRSDGVRPPERKIKTYGGLPQWDGTPGKTLICFGEQGVGDEIMFASILPDLMRDNRVIIDCDKRLERLFCRSFPQAEAVYPTSGIDDPFPWIANHKPDAWVAMGSLGHFYRPDFASFPREPFLEADPAMIEDWAGILGHTKKLRVGLSWAGGLKKTRFDQRSMMLKTWAPFLTVPGIEWYSLQYHPQAADEAAQVGSEIGIPIHHWGDMIASYDQTAGFLQNLDLVISVNTSLIHLAGSLGIPTWCLTPVMCAWRYQCKGPNPWYGSVDTIRQQKPMEWEPVIEEVRQRLVEIVRHAD